MVSGLGRLLVEGLRLWGGDLDFLAALGVLVQGIPGANRYLMCFFVVYGVVISSLGFAVQLSRFVCLSCREPV